MGSKSKRVSLFSERMLIKHLSLTHFVRFKYNSFIRIPDLLIHFLLRQLVYAVPPVPAVPPAASCDPFHEADPAAAVPFA